MKSINRVILLGRLGANPVKRLTKSGTSVVHFPLATTQRTVKKQNDETANPTEDSKTTFVEETCWHQIVAWGKLADHCAEYLEKGEPVYVDGSVVSRSYEGKDGQKKYSVEIHASQMSFLGRLGQSSKEKVEELAS